MVEYLAMHVELSFDEILLTESDWSVKAVDDVQFLAKKGQQPVFLVDIGSVSGKEAITSSYTCKIPLSKIWFSEPECNQSFYGIKDIKIL